VTSARWMKVVIAGVVVAFVAAIITIVYYVNREAENSVAVCKMVADRSRIAAIYGDSPMPSSEYMKLRNAFVDAGNENVGEAGTAFVDAAWQMSNMDSMGPDYDFFEMAMAQKLVDAYNSLLTECGRHDVQLPTLADLAEIRKSAQPIPTPSK
jgi:hypothetical protein